jgi:predicted aspartyl protease
MASRVRSNLNRAANIGRLTSSVSSSTNTKTLEILVDKILHKDIIPQPKVFHRHQNILVHLTNVKKYIEAVNISHESSKVAVLINSLDEEIQIELFSQPTYCDEFLWLEKTLLQLYQKKVTAASPLIYLLGVKQKPDQTLKEFMTELRVEIFRHWPQMEDAKKEEFLITAFLNGIADRDVSIAIQALHPFCLEEAYNLAKKECKFRDNKSKGESYLRTLHPETVAISTMQEQINSLQSKVKHLEFMLQALTKNTYSNVVRGSSGPNYQPYRTKPQPNIYRPEHRINTGYKKNDGMHPFVQKERRSGPIRCFNCNELGHIARFCTKVIRCSICGGNNHLSTNCLSNGRKKFIRQLEYESGEELAEEFDSSDKEASIANEEAGDCCALLTTTNKIIGLSQQSNHQEKKFNKKFGASPNELDEVNKWNDYIHGTGVKPKYKRIQSPKVFVMDNQTLISKSNSEPARNKPVIVGECAGEKMNIFLDTGAEMNVIDSVQLSDMIKRQLPISFKQTSTKIRCANGSSMQVTGEALFSVRIGSVRAVQKFQVVRNLFPKIIIGIRTMKTMNISVKPSDDCAYIGETFKVPFKSRVVAQTVYEDCPGKVYGTPLGAKEIPY